MTRTPRETYLNERELVIIASSAAAFLVLDSVSVVSLIYVAVISWGIRRRTTFILINIEQVVSVAFRGAMWFSAAGSLHIPVILTVLGYYILGFVAVLFYRLVLRFTPIPRIVSSAFGYEKAFDR